MGGENYLDSSLVEEVLTDDLKKESESVRGKSRLVLHLARDWFSTRITAVRSRLRISIRLLGFRTDLELGYQFPRRAVELIDCSYLAAVDVRVAARLRPLFFCLSFPPWSTPP